MAFSDRERNLLLATPGIVLAVDTVCNTLGSSAWVNRRRPLQRLLSQ